MSAASVSETSGPTASTTMPSRGISFTSARTTSTSAREAIAPVTSRANASRSTASAAPAGTRVRRAHATISESSRAISALRSPWGVDSSSDLRLLEQTSSARSPVRWTGVPRTGRISWRTTGTPRRAICQAASLPASPPPTTVTRLGSKAASLPPLARNSPETTPNHSGSPRRRRPAGGGGRQAARFAGLRIGMYSFSAARLQGDLVKLRTIPCSSRGSTAHGGHTGDWFMDLRKKVAIGAAIVLSAAAVYAKKPAKTQDAATAPAPAAASDVVAYVNDEPITRDELNKAAASQLMQVRQKEYEILSDTAEALAIQKALDKEAA